LKAEIRYFTENIQFNLRNRILLRKWICMTALAESKKVGAVNFIFCNDGFLSEINSKYLKHNTLTDIITFPFSEDRAVISGEVYISVPRVRENAVKFNVSFENELHRVMIHGILHLAGYTDYSKSAKMEMRRLEDHALQVLGDMPA
jgi:probable rRNA maturation factor